MYTQKFSQTFFYKILFTLFCIFLLIKVAVAAGEWTILQERAPDDIPYDLNGVSFVDKNNGWIVGEAIFEDMRGYIAHTRDGGSTWETQESPSETTLSDVCFVNKKHGWAVGEKGVIVSTKDGGKRWNPQKCGQGNWLYGVHFVNKDIGYAVGMSETILKTDNGGRTWKILKGGEILSNLGEEETVIYNSVYFINENVGWAVGVHVIPPAQQNGAVHYTTDGGKNWTTQTTNVEDILKDVYFIDANTGWVVGENGVILYTEDAGETWAVQKSGTEEHLQSISFADAKNGWAVGGSMGVPPVIVGTTNGGKTWALYKKLEEKLKESRIYIKLNSVEVIGPKNYCAVGEGGVILGKK